MSYATDQLNKSRVSIEKIIKLDEDAGHYFFSKGAKQFFDSRWSDDAYEKDGYAYFITSEKFRGDPFGGVKSLPRKYTIRKANLATGDVSTFGNFQEYRSRREALSAIKEMIK